MRPYQAIIALDQVRNSFAPPLRRKGVELSARDTETVFEVYQQWLLLLLDLGYLHPETLLRDGLRLWRDLVTEDVLTLNSCFAECLAALRRQELKGFKALCSRISSHLFSFVKIDVERVQGSDVYAAKRLMQLFSYTSRLTLHDIDLTQQMIEDYLRVEETMYTWDPTHQPLLDELNKIIRRWFPLWAPPLEEGGHGPGGVAGHGRCSLETKYKDLSQDSLTSYAFPSYTPPSRNIRSSLDRISQTVFVPKSFKTFRTISMEPSTLQFLQQSVWRSIERCVHGDWFLRNHFGFRDQSRNALAAKEGSSLRTMATLDLSSASDSVCYDLVKRLFRGTWLLRFLVATRSSKTILPDGRIVSLKKFAPMGSSLCFPVETIIFAAICDHVTRVSGVSGKYTVYGDDIIVPTQCVKSTISILQRLGFSINIEKSFVDLTNWFRESCGAEYCDGFDVTPMRVSRRYNCRERDTHLDGLVSSANTAFLRGYTNLRAFFIRKIRTEGLVPLFAPTALLSSNYTNYGAKRRWNKDLQRIDVRVHSEHAHSSRDDLCSQDEDIRYHHWLLSTSGRSAIGDGFESVICQVTTNQKYSWMRKPYEESDNLFISSSREKGKTLPFKK